MEKPTWPPRPNLDPKVPFHLKLPPRPGVKLRTACPKCGILHTERRDLLECLSQSGHNP